ncbi:MAG TPA: dienelactone hydrolase family protein [Nitrospiraceae bacterium]|nr:dienelactone hydrolase family protein [Nitrospiraceae bacterium]
MQLHLVAVMSAMVLFASTAAGEVRTNEIVYKQGDTVLQGFLAWNDAVQDKRPGVLVVHEWWGHNDHVRHQAKRLAEAGYVGFALDMFGKGKVTTHPNEAQAFMAEAKKDPAVLKARFQAALEQLKQDSHVAPDRIAAIGYCFGGSVVLDEARDPAPIWMRW